MKIKYSSVDNSVWDSWLSEFPLASFDYHSLRIEYDLQYLSKVLVSNESLILSNDGIKLLCIIYVVNGNGVNEISYNGSFLPSPVFNLIKNNRSYKRALKLLNQEIDKIVLKFKVKTVKFSINSILNSQQNYLNHNFFLRLGFTDKSFNTQVIDLNSSIEEIIADFDTSTRYDIRNSIGDIHICNYDSIRYDDILEYREIHYKAAGRRTRSIKTYKIMFEWIRNDLATLFFNVIDGSRVSVILVTHFNGHANYGSAATLPYFEREAGISEKLQLKIIEYLKNKGINYYELGHQYFNGDTLRLDLDAKMISISRYKRKFGGITIPVFAAIKEY